MKAHLLVPLLPLILLMTLRGVATPQETQVPLDEGDKITVVDKALEAQLGLFPEYESFEEARLFQSSDSTFNLEIIFRVGDKLQKVSRPLSGDDVLALRARVTSAIRARAPETGLDQSGRSAFLISTALLSLGYYGWAVPYVLNIDDGRAFGGIYMLTSGLGFFGPFFLTRTRSVTDGEATLSLYGATRGVVHGWCVSALIAGEDREARDTITSGMLTSLSEYAAGFIAADKTGMSAGTAEAISAVGDFGLGLGWGTAYVADRENEKLEAGAMLAGSGLGLLGGGLLSRTQHYTRGDAYVLRAAGALGAYLALAGSASVSDDDKAAVASSMAGALGGLAAGHYLLRGKDFTTGQGVIVNLSQVAGGLFAAGLVFITGVDADPVWPYMVSSSAGALTGFWLTSRSLGDKARTHGRSSSTLRLDICPEGLLALAGARSANHRSGAFAGQAMPVVKLQYRF
jgi:hypothetical protein